MILVLGICSTSAMSLWDIITGDLTIIGDAKLRTLISKGLSYREQNCVNWKINREICTQAAAAYKRKWAKRERVDYRVLNEWEHRVNECIERRIRLLENVDSIYSELGGIYITYMIFIINMY